MILIAALGAYRSGSQIVAMRLYTTHSDRPSLERASRIDPANFRLHLRLARGGKLRCAHARAAHALFPSAQVAKQLMRGCS